MGAISMTGFFMLSGYSVYQGYCNIITKADCKRFYIKRAVNILPLYYTVSLLFVFVISQESIIRKILLVPVVFLGLQAVFSSLFPYSHISGTWFISCILLFYLVYPLVARLLENTERMGLLIVLTIVIWFFIVYSTILVNQFGLHGVYTNPFIRILECIVGVFLAWIMKRRKKAIKKPGLVLLLGIVIQIICITVLYSRIIARGIFIFYDIVAIPTFVICIAAASKIEIKNNKIVPVVVLLSRISYPFYLGKHRTVYKAREIW